MKPVLLSLCVLLLSGPALAKTPQRAIQQQPLPMGNLATDTALVPDRPGKPPRKAPAFGAQQWQAELNWRQKLKLKAAEKLLKLRLGKDRQPEKNQATQALRGQEKKSLVVALIGLGVILIGGIADIGILVTIGGILLVVGLVVFLLYYLDVL